MSDSFVFVSVYLSATLGQLKHRLVCHICPPHYQHDQTDAEEKTLQLPPFSAEKIGLSLSHLVPEILGPKVGVIFHQNVLFNRF